MYSSISAFEMIKIGVGPSSSHTMGPWNAANRFVNELKKANLLARTNLLNVLLYGSLAKTGKGHGTDVAALLGLCGEDFKTIDTRTILPRFEQIKQIKQLPLAGVSLIRFDYAADVQFLMKEQLPFHPNGMVIKAFRDKEIVLEKTYFSVGGGFVVEEGEDKNPIPAIVTPFPCHSAAAILTNCQQQSLRVSELVRLNETAWRTPAGIQAQALAIWQEIKACAFRGAYTDGILPGGLNVKRRAPAINRQLLGNQTFENPDSWIAAIRQTGVDFGNVNRWITCFALAVNEENASFGRVITSPTNGAAGVLPAVLLYAYCFLNQVSDSHITDFIVTAGEIGTLFKKNATISAAMGGCQAEIGVSSAMSAAALTDIQGGTPQQVLSAAEIAMEHHLGLTCDPIGGLVQIPCIERNTMGAMKAITASNLALSSDAGDAKVSLDSVIATMWQTALDMSSKYKETSEGGLAMQISVGLAEC
jgi:L-serine dehydratase